VTTNIYASFLFKHEVCHLTGR